MEAIVAYECGFLDATNLLMTGEYLSPYMTLERTKYIIKDHELEAYYRGCADAVAQYKGVKL